MSVGPKRAEHTNCSAIYFYTKRSRQTPIQIGVYICSWGLPLYLCLCLFIYRHVHARVDRPFLSVRQLSAEKHIYNHKGTHIRRIGKSQKQQKRQNSSEKKNSFRQNARSRWHNSEIVPLANEFSAKNQAYATWCAAKQLKIRIVLLCHFLSAQNQMIFQSMP